MQRRRSRKRFQDEEDDCNTRRSDDDNNDAEVAALVRSSDYTITTAKGSSCSGRSSLSLQEGFRSVENPQTKRPRLSRRRRRLVGSVITLAPQRFRRGLCVGVARKKISIQPRPRRPQRPITGNDDDDASRVCACVPHVRPRPGMISRVGRGEIRNDDTMHRCCVDGRRSVVYIRLCSPFA